jgi:RNA-directed DNA polymerase
LKLWSWAKRRHPNKNPTWIKEKYFKSTGTRNWVFQTTLPIEKGKLHTIRLANAMDVAIKRHIKIKNGANPYDPEWEIYLCAVSSATRSATNVAKSLGIFCTHRA